MTLTDGKVSLRPFTERHADRRYLGWFRNPAIRRFITHRPNTIAEARAYVMARLVDPGCRFFSIYLKDRRVGTLKLERSRPDPKVWWLGLMIGEKSAQGHGVGPRAIWLACCYVFDQLPAEEIMAGMARDNHDAVKAFIKAGFAYRDFPGRPADVLAWKRR